MEDDCKTLGKIVRRGGGQTCNRFLLQSNLLQYAVAIHIEEDQSRSPFGTILLSPLGRGTRRRTGLGSAGSTSFMRSRRKRGRSYAYIRIYGRWSIHGNAIEHVWWWRWRMVGTTGIREQKIDQSKAKTRVAARRLLLLGLGRLCLLGATELRARRRRLVG